MTSFWKRGSKEKEKQPVDLRERLGVAPVSVNEKDERFFYHIPMYVGMCEEGDTIWVARDDLRIVVVNENEGCLFVRYDAPIHITPDYADCLLVRKADKFSIRNLESGATIRRADFSIEDVLEYSHREKGIVLVYDGMLNYYILCDLWENDEKSRTSSG